MTADCTSEGDDGLTVFANDEKPDALLKSSRKPEAA